MQQCHLRWVEEGYRLSALDLSRDQQARAEVYDAIQRVLDDGDPDAGLPGGGQRRRRQHRRP
jgi:hypothetical protein